MEPNETPAPAPQGLTCKSSNTAPLAAKLVVGVRGRALIQLEQVLQVLRRQGVHLMHRGVCTRGAGAKERSFLHGRDSLFLVFTSNQRSQRISGLLMHGSFEDKQQFQIPRWRRGSGIEPLKVWRPLDVQG